MVCMVCVRKADSVHPVLPVQGEHLVRAVSLQDKVVVMADNAALPVSVARAEHLTHRNHRISRSDQLYGQPEVPPMAGFRVSAGASPGKRIFAANLL
jgi:hypothetical protein